MNPLQLLIKHKYAIGGVLVFMIASYIYYKLRDKDTEIVQEGVDKPKESVVKPNASQEFDDLQKLIRIFTHEMKNHRNL